VDPLETGPAKHIPLYAGAGMALAVLLVYGQTLAPGLTFIDSGELAAACARLGIAHPTGYPLYTLAGWMFTRIPIHVRPIELLNFMSALFSAGAVFFFFLFLFRLFSSFPGSAAGTGKAPACLCALGGALLLAFSKVFWSAALVTEVYALQSFFTCVLLALILKACVPGGTGTRGSPVPLSLLFFTLGLSFCNHMSTVLMVPALLWALFNSSDTRRPGRKKAFFLCCFFLLGLAPYVYLPLRAAQQPALNWGDPCGWEAFVRHVSGSQYRVWMFSAPEVMLRQGRYFLELFVRSFGYVPVILVLPGLWHLFRRCRFWFLFSVIFFASDILYAVNYDIIDIDSYFLPAFITGGLWMASGMLVVTETLLKQKKWPCSAAAYAVCLLPLTPLMYNYNDADESTNCLVEQYAGDILDGMEKNALVLSYQWDYFCSPLYYLQLVEGLRTDVIMIEVKLLKRSWYLTALEKNHPALIKKSAGEAKAYRRELNKFEHGLPYDAGVIQRRYLALINSFIRENIENCPVYLTCEQEPEIGAGFQRVPEGLVFRLYPQNRLYTRFAFSKLTIPEEKAFRKGDRYAKAVKTFYCFMLTARGLYELNYGHAVSAEALIQRALALDPGYSFAREMMKKMQGQKRE